eukprot:CAMPEP_0195292008 /NCGR_PEP_ID=MMETSP0707-20130614/8557_1 /TAXON_ID=33640 /ORGANISM="Asterionellopsis glacialis, Strain CCMP134" /LENGTH=510 /DNA_ID=CAMNT_0040352379 /DNA_START=64 /DNA_END=1596 /DNA_ORIENTATION=+
MAMAGPAAPQNGQEPVRPEDAASHITVSDPVQHTEGMNKYTSYRVDVRPPTTAPSTDNQDIMLANTTYSAVLRRYSDFLWLYERLHRERAGAIVPPLPEKQAVARFTAAFVEDRRVNLERFLRRVAVHPELGDAKCLDTFLRADDITFKAAKNSQADVVLSQPLGQSIQVDPSMQHQQQQQSPPGAHMQPPRMPPPKKEGFKRWFAEAKTSISGDLVKSPDDDIFEEINRYVHGLDTQMKNVYGQASGLVRKGKEIANGLFEFGLAFNLLGQSEADALGNALGQMGDAADRLSVLSAEHAEREMAKFEEPLLDYIKTIHSVKLALQRRHEKRLTYSTCLATMEAKQTNLAKLRATPGMEAKAYAAEMSLRRSQEACNTAQDDFATVSQRVLREVDRFKREKAEDMRRTVLDYINLQVEYNKKMEEVWANLIPQLESVQLEGGGGEAAPVVSNPNAPSSAVNQPPVATEQQQQQPYYNQHKNNAVTPAPPTVNDPSNISVQYRSDPPLAGM